MLSVNVSDIRSHSKELRRLISAYEVTSMSIVREIRNLDTEWHDDNSEVFFSLSDTQKKDIAMFIESMEDVCNRYDSIAEATEAIDSSIRRVFCNTEYRGIVKNKYDSAISKISSMRNTLANSSTYFCKWSERSSINSAKSALNRAITKLQNSSNKVDRLFDKLSKLENTITSKLSGISISNIPELDVSYFLR